MAYIKLEDALQVCSEAEEWYTETNEQQCAVVSDDIYQQIANLPTADVVEVKWTNVDDRLPEKADWYLVYAENQRPFVAYFKGKTFPLNNHYHKITHWMPLPEPPKEGAE